MSKRDYYEVLGVDKNANDQEIKRAYRQLAKKYHPDVSTEKDAEAKFKEVQEAYDVLSDDQKRAGYDRFGHAGAQGFGQGGAGFSDFGDFGFGGFEDIFSSFFGGGGSRRNANAPRKGNDIRQQMNITFEEAVFGASKELKISRHEECTKCGGTGAHSKGDIITCSRCHGSGTVVVEQQSILGRVQTQTTCPNCHGKGKEIKKACSVCHGKGRTIKSKTISVKVPKGIDDGQQIRLTGQGEAGINGGPSGDLYILFRVKKHDYFERMNDNIYCELPLSFSQVALGEEVEIPTLYGKVKFNIPPGTQPGSEFRLRGKGVESIRTGRKGDQYVKVKVITPKKLNSEQKKLFEKLSEFNDHHEDTLFDKVKNVFNSFKK